MPFATLVRTNELEGDAHSDFSALRICVLRLSITVEKRLLLFPADGWKVTPAMKALADILQEGCPLKRPCDGICGRACTHA